MKLSSHGGRTISAIESVILGDPQGSCVFFKKGTSEVPNSLCSADNKSHAVTKENIAIMLCDDVIFI